MKRHWGNTFLVAMARALCIFFITGMPTISCFAQASDPLFCAGVVLCLFCGSLDFSLPVRLCQTSSVTIGQPAEYSILMQNSGKDNACFCFDCTQRGYALIQGIPHIQHAKKPCLRKEARRFFTDSNMRFFIAQSG